MRRAIGQYLPFCSHLFFFSQKNFRTILYAGNFNNFISTGGGNGKPLQYSCLESPISSMKRQKDMTPGWKISPPGWKVSNMLLGKSEGQLLIDPERNAAGPKQKRCSAVDVSGGESKVQCCKEQYCRLQKKVKDRGAWRAAVHEVAKSRT